MGIIVNIVIPYTRYEPIKTRVSLLKAVVYSYDIINKYYLINSLLACALPGNGAKNAY